MNLATYRSRVARVVGMHATADATLIDGWVNEGIEQFLKETKIHLVTAVLGVSADQADYTLDTDILAMQALWYEPAGSSLTRRLLEPVSVETMMQLRFPQQVEQSGVSHYSIAGASTLLLHPAPSSDADLLHILYVPRHDAMSATADSPDQANHGNIPLEYHTLIEAYAKWKAAEAEEHRGSQNGMVFRSEWEMGIAKARGEVKRKAGMVMPSVRLGRNSRPVNLGNGVDLGV